MVNVILLFFVSSCTRKPAKTTGPQPFDAQKWKQGRYNNPELNDSPWMVNDLIKNHLKSGMLLEDVLQLLGQPRVRYSTSINVTAIRGEYEEETVYVYKPGYKKGWFVESDQPMEIHFRGYDDSYTTPGGCKIRYVDAPKSTLNELRTWHDDELDYTYCLPPNTLQAVLELFGEPDEIKTEYNLEYYLGKKYQFSMDDSFLVLHFDSNNKLKNITYMEH